MPYTDLFMQDETTPKTGAKLPDSCIESAEYAIQSIYNGKLIDWNPGQTRDPHVIAHFGNAKTVDVTNHENLVNYADINKKSLVDYALGETFPKVGRGIIFLRVKGIDTTNEYNMHLAATLSTKYITRFRQQYVVTDMMEPFNSSVNMVFMKAKKVSSIDELKTACFGDSSSDYVTGLLKAEGDDGPDL